MGSISVRDFGIESERGGARMDKAKVKEGGQTLDGIKKRTGLRDRRYRFDSEYYLAPRRPPKDVPRRDSASLFPSSRKAPSPPYSSMSIESPVQVQSDGSPRKRIR